MYTIEFIKSILILKNGIYIAKEPLFRPEKQIQLYLDYVEECKKKYGSIENHIMKNVVNNFIVPIVFVDNNFPYDLEPGIKHKTLWSNKELSGEEINNYLENFVDTKYKFIWFENSAEFKSVPNIKHYHVILYQ